ncbi:MAG: DNA repair protein RecN [bacterium]|nr:DNA repair protein RecN [bacterium]
MLVELAISDLALIEGATLGFGGGLNVITGETGAGKSLLIDALELLLGQRARSGMVRGGAQRARVEGRFLVAPTGYGELARGWLREHLPDTLDELEEEAGPDGELELILTRTIGRDGRSRAHVNHRPVTQRVLRELAAHLVEIHGQNDHQKLFEPSEQLRLLDTFAGTEDSLAGYRERRARWLQLAERLEDFDRGEADRLQRLDLLRFQAAELEEAGDDLAGRSELVDERALLRHAGELSRDLGASLQELSEGEGAALDVLRRAERRIDEWAEKVGGLSVPAESAREAVAHLEECVAALLSIAGEIEANPARLEELETRLSRVEQLERKYRDDAEGLLARRTAIEEELGTLEGEEVGRDDLERRTNEARESLEDSARRVMEMREGARGRLEVAVHSGLEGLGLQRAKFEANVVERELDDDADGFAAARRRFTAEGTSAVEFLLAANPGEPNQPLRKVASGGEMARIMLALRGALAVRQSTPTLVFDEVDSGVGGRLGPQVGAQLGALAQHHQILCVTHLPAIAARAQCHLRVAKQVSSGRTRTRVEVLSGDERVEEIADMIAGGSAHETARAEARRLLQDA